MKRQFVLLAVATALVGPAFYSLTKRDPAAKTLTLVSEPYRLDKIYHSMEGPWSIERGIRLTTGERSAVQWVTGLEAQIIEATEQKPISQEFFCHSNLTFAEHNPTPSQYNQRFGGKTHLDWRLFTLVPGRLSIELPEGFGIPIPAGAPFDYFTMSLNMNAKNVGANVRMRTTVHTIAADQPAAPTKALFRRALYVLQPQREAANMRPASMTDSEPHHTGAGCADSCKVNLSAVSAVGKPGEGQTPHWLVPRGHHIYTTEITPQLNLPFDTTIHYATIHVHPFARGMELRDLTTGTTILRLKSQDWSDRLGVAHVDELKSIQGIPIFRDHRYELIAEYENPVDSQTDAMGIPLPLSPGEGSDVVFAPSGERAAIAGSSRGGYSPREP